MLEMFLEHLGDILFDVLVWLLRATGVVLSARLVFYLLGVSDTLSVAPAGLKMLFLGN